MSRLDNFSEQWLAGLEQITQHLTQNPIASDAIIAQVNVLENEIAQAEDAWRDADPVALEAQLAGLKQQQEQVQLRLDTARAQGLTQITGTTKQLKRKLNAMERLVALANANKTLDKFQAGVLELCETRDAHNRTLEQHNARLDQMKEELEELAQARQSLEEELEQYRAQAHTRELRQECLEQAQSTHPLWRTLREQIAPEASATNG